jgi:hypothetical protein
MSDEKKIEIVGTSNRYQINKLKKEEKSVKMRKTTEKIGLPKDYYSIENQFKILNDLHNKTIHYIQSEHRQVILSQIETKLYGYKQQDQLKKRLNSELLIKTDDTIKLLYDCRLKCYYCQENTMILYDIVREMNQWSLDRIDNNIGHNSGNVLISCLSCNLKRRKTGKDAFLFTKQLNIVKS